MDESLSGEEQQDEANPSSPYCLLDFVVKPLLVLLVPRAPAFGRVIKGPVISTVFATLVRCVKSVSQEGWMKYVGESVY